MLEFVNDPQFDGVPLVGEGQVLIAERKFCGRAARWLPGGDVAALAEFLGPEYPVLEGELYFRQPDRSLQLVDLSRPFLVVVRPAGEPVMVGNPDHFTQGWAQAVEVQVEGVALSAEETQAQLDKIAAAKAEKAAAKKAAAAEKAAAEG
jgi:hypothetical protein